MISHVTSKDPVTAAQPTFIDKKVAAIVVIALTALSIGTKIALNYYGALPFVVTANLPLAIGIAAGLIITVAIAACIYSKKPRPVNPIDLNVSLAQAMETIATLDEQEISKDKPLSLAEIPGLEKTLDFMDEALLLEEQLKNRLRQGAMAHHESELEKLLKNPAQKEERRAALRDRLQHVLRMEYINQQLTTKHRYLNGGMHEQRVLKELGYDVLKYRNKTLLTQAFELVITSHYDELVSGSVTVAGLKQKLIEIGEVTRLKAANVPLETIPRLQAFLKITLGWKNQAKEALAAEMKQADYLAAITHEEFKDVVQTRIENEQIKFSGVAVASFLKSAVQYKLKEILETNDEDLWSQTIKLLQTRFSDGLPSQAKKKFKRINAPKAPQEPCKTASLYKNWNDNVVKAVIQGWDDEASVLSQGVCYANTLRSMVEEQNLTEGDPDQAIQWGIQMKDRVNQARYINAVWLIRADETNKNGALPIDGSLDVRILNEVLSKIDRNKIGVLLTDSTINTGAPVSRQEVQEGIKQVILANESRLVKTNGIAMLNIGLKMGGGHAQYIRFDRQNNIFRFYDCNFGRVKLDNEEQFFEFIAQLYDTCYSDVYGFEMFLLMPKADEPAPQVPQIPVCSSSTVI
jgi:hypothetical protein